MWSFIFVSLSVSLCFVVITYIFFGFLVFFSVVAADGGIAAAVGFVVVGVVLGVCVFFFFCSYSLFSFFRSFDFDCFCFFLSILVFCFCYAKWYYSHICTKERGGGGILYFKKQKGNL